MNMLEYIERLVEMEAELTQMAKRIKPMIPENPTLYEPTQMAWNSIGGAASACAQGSKYLREAVKKALG